MIQRIQSIWFLLASACIFLTLKFPFYSGTNKDNQPSYQLVGTENWYIMILTILIGLIAFLAIFLYNNRRLQVRLGMFGMLLEIILLVLYYFQVIKFVEGTGTMALTSLLHGMVLFFFFLALRAIGKDIKIVRDSDRLR